MMGSPKMKLSVTSLLAALMLASPALAQSSDDITGSIATMVTRTAPSGKLATKTEVIPDRQEPAMLTQGSLRAMDGAIAMYEDILQRGGWPAVAEHDLAKGARSDGVIALRQRLIAEGYLSFDSLAGPSPATFDGDLRSAVKAFQGNHGLAGTGKVDDRTLAELNVPARARLDTLYLNRTRIAAYSEGLGSRYILVNIPSAQLEAVNGGIVYSRHNIIAGKLDRPSPAVNSKVSEINFNPYWNAPVSIVRRDLIPKLLKDPDAMAKMHVRVFDGFNGPEIDPHLVDWSVTPADRYFFRQDPGDQNAMASMKINFPNKYNVYLHDTPARELFGQNARFVSSGCIRVDQVQVLVDWILSGQDGFDVNAIETIAETGERLDQPVRDGPDIRIMYLTAWASEDGAIHFRPDIYDLDRTGFILGQPEPQNAT
ncbi:L,D-transpeptidase family protein [soil metagenome]